MICKNCNAENADTAIYCNQCGYLLKAEKKPKPVITHITGKPTIVSGTKYGAAREVVKISRTAMPPPGMCFYHHQLVATFVCNRCGRLICRCCAQTYGTLVFCPHCRQF
jgi:hypothetical protein